jgi:hypothetical protein
VILNKQIGFSIVNLVNTPLFQNTPLFPGCRNITCGRGTHFTLDQAKATPILASNSILLLLEDLVDTASDATMTIDSSIYLLPQKDYDIKSGNDKDDIFEPGHESNDGSYQQQTPLPSEQ